MRLTEFDYELPEELIALEPSPERDGSRLLVVNRQNGDFRHGNFRELPGLLRAGDALVMNNSKVLPARLWGHDSTGRRFEILLVKKLSSDRRHWECLARPGRRIAGDKILTFKDDRKAVIRRKPERDFTIEFDDDPLDWIIKFGVPPLPPYIKREPTPADVERYQTVYAKQWGSVAAPTAGLHFTPSLIDTISKAGVSLIELTLHVGYGTFSPIRAEQIEDHRMHEESYEISQAAYEQLTNVKKAGGRIIAVGTTAMRTLESIPEHGLKGTTDIFITPGYQFRWVDGLITNFHLPKSSLYILVSAFLGLDQTRTIYRAAVENRYRFFSYGDATAIL